MASMDIFNDDAFSMVSLTQAIERIDYQPTLLGSLGLFEPEPTRTPTIMIEKREGSFALVKTDQRGSPIQQRANEKRDIRPFLTRRVAQGDRINASEILAIRAFGSETELLQVQAEVARRYSGPTGVLTNIETTNEFMRLGAIQGIVVDADGSVLDNWFDNWDVSQPAEIDFELDDVNTDVRKKCTLVIRAMAQASKGSFIPGRTQVHALAGDTFYDDLTGHASVKATFNGWAAAADLRQGNAYSAFTFGDITFHNYRGSDVFVSQATAGKGGFGIDSQKAKFFPVGAPGVFKQAYAPGESFGHLQLPPQMVYGMVVRDEKRDMWVDVEGYSYPLFVCTNPAMLQRAKDH